MKLNLGCGDKLLHGFVNIDKYYDKADVKHDLNIFPYPFKDESCHYILLSHVLEHLKNPIRVIDECWRILEYNGILEIFVPYYKHHGAYDNPAHIRYFTKESFEFFVQHGNNTKNFKDRYNVNLFRRKAFCKTYSGRFPCWHLFTYLNIHIGKQIIHCILIK